MLLTFILMIACLCAGVGSGIWLERSGAPRDVVWMHGFTEDRRKHAIASAADVRSAYRAAGKPAPIILNVPPEITITRDAAR